MSKGEHVTKPETTRSSWGVTVGLLGLLVWLVGGLLLESLHGMKSVFYLEDEMRREMWILAHAHGTLFSALCLLLTLVMASLSLPSTTQRRVDRLFAVGAALLPWGFFFGGWVHSESDPGLGILLVPVGGLLCGAGLVILIWSWWHRAAEEM